MTALAAEGARPPAEAAAAAYAASLAASGVAGDDSGASPAAAKARKIAELRARLAAARAARAAEGVGAEQPTMELAPGAADFPDDYDALQLADQAAVLAEAREAGVGGGGGVALRSSYAQQAGDLTSAGALAAVASAADFDPFGNSGQRAGAGAAGAGASSRAAAPRARAVSPLPADTKAAIAEVMSRIKLSPRPGSISSFTETLVAAALERGRRARGGPAAPAQAPT